MAADITQLRNRQAQFEEQKVKVKGNTRDSVFVSLFSEPEYQLQAYKALHPEDTTVTVDDIRQLTLESVFVNTDYNDLGIAVRDKSLILIEAQSTWSYNILVRLLMYYAATCTNYIQQHQYSRYSSRKVKIPEPEFVVVYVGEEKELPDVISLNDEFFNGSNRYLELKAKVIQHKQGDDILSQYIEFSEIYRKMFKQYKNDRRKVVIETIESCKQAGVLQSFLTLHEREVYDMMSSLFDIEYERKLLQAQEAREREEELQEAIKEAKEKVTKEVSEKVAKEVREEVTKEVSEKVTKEVSEKVAKEVSEKVARETGKSNSEAIAKNLLQLGKLSTEEISQMTGLSIEEVETL